VTIHRALLVSLAHTVIKFFKRLILLAKHARRERIRRQKVLPTSPIATIVPRANIQRKEEIPRNANATIVKQIHLVPNLDEANRVTRVKKERHQRKVQPFVLAVVLVPI
jgi:hypothetical protein